MRGFCFPPFASSDRTTSSHDWPRIDATSCPNCGGRITWQHELWSCSCGLARPEPEIEGGGTAVEETLFRGQPHEMVTLYHRDGPRLLLTHYCAAGNQPTMVLAPGDDAARPRFEFLRASNLPDPKAGHMHRASFDLSEPGRLTARWTFFQDGQPGEEAVIAVRRTE